MPFVFIDEAESILGTRRAGRYSNVLSTLVPMFCTEMDGIESLNEVVIILASNRADLIDPAILRPGRIDRKIKVDRPDREAAREIYRIYLSEDLPYDPELIKRTGGIPQAVSHLIDKVVEAQFSRKDENRFLDVILRSGKRDTLFRGDLVSGAIIASIVERTKELAIKRAINSTQEEGISESDLLLSLNTEYSENDIFPPTDIVEDWLKLIDYDSENVVKVSPVRGMRDRRENLMSFNLVLSPDAPLSCMKRVFGIETEYGITVNGVETVDVVTESIELVRCYTEHGASDEMGLRPGRSAPGRSRFPCAIPDAGHRRVGLL